MAKSKLKEVQIQVAPGVIVTAEISDIGELKSILDELDSAGYKPTTESVDVKPIIEKQKGRKDNGDSPDSRVEIRADITAGLLNKLNILAFKDDVPQLLRPSNFSKVSDAALTLLFAVEIGLKTSSIPFDDLKAIYDEQNIKSGSPLTMLLTNLKNAGYIDKRMYSADRTVRLTAKGEQKAIKVLKALVAE